MNSKIIYLECIPELLEKYNAGEEQLVSLLKKYGFKVFQVKGEKLIENKVDEVIRKKCFWQKKCPSDRTSFPQTFFYRSKCFLKS